MSSPFEQLFDISPFPAVITRLRDNSVIAINRRTSEMFGISHAEALGLTTTLLAGCRNHHLGGLQVHRSVVPPEF